MRLYSSVAGGLGNAQRRLIDDQWSARYRCCLLRIVRGRYVTVTTRKLQQSYLRSYISLGFTRFDWESRAILDGVQKIKVLQTKI
jgi:hypothetical protein